MVGWDRWSHGRTIPAAPRTVAAHPVHDALSAELAPRSAATRLIVVAGSHLRMLSAAPARLRAADWITPCRVRALAELNVAIDQLQHPAQTRGKPGKPLS